MQYGIMLSKCTVFSLIFEYCFHFNTIFVSENKISCSGCNLGKGSHIKKNVNFVNLL